MSTISAVARARSRAALSADALALGGLGAFALAIVAATWGTWGDLDNDTGHDFVTGSRVAAGELPYVDFPYWYGPLAPGVLGLVARLGGDAIAPFLALGLVLAGAIVVAGYALARVHAGPAAAAAATAITVPVAFAPNQFSFVLPHTSAATLGLLALLGVLIALARAGQGPRWPVAAGACLGLTALTKPEFALAALAAVAAWLLLARPGRRSAVLLAAPALALPAAAYGAFLTAVPARTLLLENLYPADYLAAAGNTLLRARAPLTAESLVELGSRLALYAAGAAALVLIARALARRRAAVAPVLAAAAAAAVVASLAAPEALRHGLQYAWGWIPAGAVLALAVLAARRRLASEPAAAAALLALAVFAATTYAGFFLYATHAQTAAYAVPLAAAFVARLHLVELARSPQARALGVAWLAFLAAAGAGLTLKDARAESSAVAGRGGTLRERPDDARAYRAALGWIEGRTEPGERILVAPLLTSLYALSGRRPALPDVSLLPGTLAEPAAERQAIARLEREHVRVAVVDRRPFPELGHTSFGRSFHTLLDRWLTAGFDRAAVASSGRPGGPQLELWVRRMG